MAVLSIEIFASTSQDTEPMSPHQQYRLLERFTHALTFLKENSSSTRLLNFDVTPYDTGAFISALCLAATGSTAAEDIAHQLTSTMTDDAERGRWALRTGVTLVISSDN